LCFETRTNAGRNWKVASSRTAATAAPGSTRRSVTSAFVRTTYAEARNAKTPTSDALTVRSHERTTLSARPV
jgi:hypothetical protein